jgi:hypothetical protein
MTAHRFAGLAAAGCAASLLLAACSSGTSTAGPTAPDTTSVPASSAGPARAAGPGSVVTVGGSIGTFPIPPGAKVLNSLTVGGRGVVVLLDSVTPAAASSFYSSALPRAGYKIMASTRTSPPGADWSGAAIEFTGHGYKGTIRGLSGSQVQSASLGNGDVFEISLTPG